MADVVSQLSLCKQGRAEIDTTVPFQSVMAAVSLFGEKVDLKNRRLPEKHGAKEGELQEELIRMKLQLSESEKDKTNAFAEVRDTKKILDEMTIWLGESLLTKPIEIHDISVRSTTGKLNQSSTQPEENHVVWDVQLKVAQEQHMTALAQLESAEKELENLQRELLGSLSEKECSVMQADDALAAAEFNAKRVEEMDNEILGTSESLILVKLASMEASKKRTAILAAKTAEGRGAADQRNSQASEHDFAIVHELELRLAAATDELNVLRGELMAAKEVEEKVNKAAAEAFANLEQAKLELERTKMPATSDSTSLNAGSAELEVAKPELQKAMDHGAALRAAIGALQSELDEMQKDLADLRGREANASIAVVSLTTELTRVKTELAAAATAEAKANEAILGLSQTLQQITAEAEEAKERAEAMKEEATRAKADAEQDKAAMYTVECELQAILKAAKAAKAAETKALSRFRAVLERTNTVRASEMEAGVCMRVSQDETDALSGQGHEVEELEHMWAAPGSAQMEAVKAGELEIQLRIETLNEDINAMKNTTKQALHRAEMAKAAKSAIESEMRLWREREATVTDIEICHGNYLQMGDMNQPLSFSNTPQAQPFA